MPCGPTRRRTRPSARSRVTSPSIRTVSTRSRSGRQRKLAHHLSAAVDVDLLARDVRVLRGDQEANDVGDFLRLAYVPERHRSIEIVDVLHARDRLGETRAHLGV